MVIVDVPQPDMFFFISLRTCELNLGHLAGSRTCELNLVGLAVVGLLLDQHGVPSALRSNLIALPNCQPLGRVVEPVWTEFPGIFFAGGRRGGEGRHLGVYLVDYSGLHSIYHRQGTMQGTDGPWDGLVTRPYPGTRAPLKGPWHTTQGTQTQTPITSTHTGHTNKEEAACLLLLS